LINLSNSCIAKELSLLAGVNNQESSIPAYPESAGNDLVRANQHLSWLQQLLDQARGIEGDVGIFGSSISGTWLAHALDGRVKFFVDEDTNRVGNKHLGLPIQSLADTIDIRPILMPIRRDIALAIQSRAGITTNLIPPPQNLSGQQP